MAWTAAAGLQISSRGLTCTSRWHYHCLMIDGGLTCPRTSISLHTLHHKGGSQGDGEVAHLHTGFPGHFDVKRKQHSDGRFLGMFWGVETFILLPASMQSLV